MEDYKIQSLIKHIQHPKLRECGMFGLGTIFVAQLIRSLPGAQDLLRRIYKKPQGTRN